MDSDFANLRQSDTIRSSSIKLPSIDFKTRKSHDKSIKSARQITEPTNNISSPKILKIKRGGSSKNINNLETKRSIRPSSR